MVPHCRLVAALLLLLAAMAANVAEPTTAAPVATAHPSSAGAGAVQPRFLGLRALGKKLSGAKRAEYAKRRKGMTEAHAAYKATAAAAAAAQQLSATVPAELSEAARLLAAVKTTVEGIQKRCREAVEGGSYGLEGETIDLFSRRMDEANSNTDNNFKFTDGLKKCRTVVGAAKKPAGNHVTPSDDTFCYFDVNKDLGLSAGKAELARLTAAQATIKKVVVDAPESECVIGRVTDATKSQAAKCDAAISAAKAKLPGSVAQHASDVSSLVASLKSHTLEQPGHDSYKKYADDKVADLQQKLKACHEAQREKLALSQQYRAAMFTAVAPCQVTQAAMHAFAANHNSGVDPSLPASVGKDKLFNKLAVRFGAKATDDNKNGITPWRNVFHGGRSGRAVNLKQFGSGSDRANIQSCLPNNGNLDQDKLGDAGCGTAHVAAVGKAALDECRSDLEALVPAADASVAAIQHSANTPSHFLSASDDGGQWKISATGNAAKPACAVACAMAMLDMGIQRNAGRHKKVMPAKSCSVVVYRIGSSATAHAALAISGWYETRPSFVDASMYATHTPAKMVANGATTDNRRAYVKTPATIVSYRNKFRAALGASADATLGAVQDQDEAMLPHDEGLHGACSEDKLLYFMEAKQRAVAVGSAFRNARA